MNAGIPENKPDGSQLDQATQEKIRQFCYELALAFRRITGRAIEEAPNQLAENVGDQKDPEPAKKSDA